MDRIIAMIAIAQLRLRLTIIEKNPHLLEGIADMADEKKPPLKIRLPIELAGLKGRMMRADTQEKAIAGVGKRYDLVQDNIDELIGAHQEHAGALEQYENELRKKIEGMVDRSNGGDPLDGGQDGHKSGDQVGQIISSETNK